MKTKSNIALKGFCIADGCCGPGLAFERFCLEKGATMETNNNFKGGVVSWRTFEDLHLSTSILFDRLRYMVMVGIDGIENREPVTNDPMPFDIMDNLIVHQEQKLKDFWETAHAEKNSKEGEDLAALHKAYDHLTKELGQAHQTIGGLQYRLEQYEGKERTDLKVVDGD